MQTHLNREPRLNSALAIAIVVGTVALSVGAFSQRQAIMANLNLAFGSQVAVASLASGTDNLLRQTSAHLSKMQRGQSIGGFPGFEPPDDDEKHRRKIRNQEYNAQDVNDWVKEINNILRQIANKNPGLTLEEILQRQGLTPGQSKGFLDALRDAHATADGMTGYGVNETTFETLDELLRVLGVSTW